MATIARSLRFPLVPLPATPSSTGSLPFGQAIPLPAPADPATQTLVHPTAPGGRGGLQNAEGKGTQPYRPTADGRTLPAQVGSFGVLVPQQNGQPLISVLLPPDVAAFLAVNPGLTPLMGLLDALLSRASGYDSAGLSRCGTIARALTRLLSSLYRNTVTTGTLTVALHTWLAQLLQTCTGTTTLFLARASEAAGTGGPLVTAAAQGVIASVLADANADVNRPSAQTANSALLTLCAGVLLP